MQSQLKILEDVLHRNWQIDLNFMWKCEAKTILKKSKLEDFYNLALKTLLSVSSEVNMTLASI